MKASTIVMASEPPVTESVSKLSELDHVPDASIKVIAQHVGIESLADEVARALAPDVEYRLREVIQDACKFMRHSKRTEISTDDINSSLVMRRCEPLYGSRGRRPHPVPRSLTTRSCTSRRTRYSTSRTSSREAPRPYNRERRAALVAVEGVQPLMPRIPRPD